MGYWEWTEYSDRRTSKRLAISYRTTASPTKKKKNKMSLIANRRTEKDTGSSWPRWREIHEEHTKRSAEIIRKYLTVMPSGQQIPQSPWLGRTSPKCLHRLLIDGVVKDGKGFWTFPRANPWWYYEKLQTYGHPGKRPLRIQLEAPSLPATTH